MGDDLFDGGGDGGCVVVVASGALALVAGDCGGAGEVAAGDLEAVEEEAGAAGVDVVGGDGAEDVADGGLEVGAIAGIGEREVEGFAAGAALVGVLDGRAAGVVVVAEVFVAEAGAGAAASVGEDVAALELLGLGGDGVRHDVGPLSLKVCKVFEANDLSPDFRTLVTHPSRCG